jgi:hypothetical protein
MNGMRSPVRKTLAGWITLSTPFIACYLMRELWGDHLFIVVGASAAVTASAVFARASLGNAVEANWRGGMMFGLLSFFLWGGSVDFLDNYGQEMGGLTALVATVGIGTQILHPLYSKGEWQFHKAMIREQIRLNQEEKPIETHKDS